MSGGRPAEHSTAFVTWIISILLVRLPSFGQQQLLGADKDTLDTELTIKPAFNKSVLNLSILITTHLDLEENETQRMRKLCCDSCYLSSSFFVIQ